MHQSFVDVKMEQDYNLPHDEDFVGVHTLVDVVGEHSQHHSPSNDYGDYAFAASAHGHIDSMYNRPVQASFSSPQPLHPLVTMPQWPSQITNPSDSNAPAVIPLHRPILPLSKTSPINTVSIAPAPGKSIQSTSTSRRTLSDSDRRRMCEYHNENPTVKQTEIGCEL